MVLNSHECLKFLALIKGWRHPLILTHARADGDALGCLVAMKSICAAWQANPRAVTFEPISSRYRFLADPAGLERWDDLRPSLNGNAPAVDGVIVLDTCATNQIEPAAAWLKESKLPVAVIDHHLTRDLDARIALIDVSAAAACQLIWEWTRAVRINLSPAAAEALFVGLATDTGWFHHSNTDARAMTAAVELMHAGVSASAMYDRLFMQEPARRLKLQTSMLATLELHSIPGAAAIAIDNGEPPSVAVMSITQAMMKFCGAFPGDTEDMVNEPMRLGCVAASLLFYEQPDGIVRIGLRSKSVAADSKLPDIDVSRVAARFGGGGHRHASGVRITGSLTEVKERMLAAVLDSIRAASS